MRTYSPDLAMTENDQMTLYFQASKQNGLKSETRVVETVWEQLRKKSSHEFDAAGRKKLVDKVEPGLLWKNLDARIFCSRALKTFAVNYKKTHMDNLAVKYRSNEHWKVLETSQLQRIENFWIKNEIKIIQ